MSALITYKIVDDRDDKLKKTARLACNFWNRFIVPNSSIVIRLGTFTSNGYTIAQAYKPYTNNDTVYGRIEFNTKYLAEFTNYEIAGTIIHEIGHTAGFGWDKWTQLFDRDTGIFKSEYIKRIPELQHMFVETDFGPGTQYSHWDEERFDEELMTGFKDSYEYVLPVTIKVMSLLGNTISRELSEKSDLETLLKEIEDIVFTRKEEAHKLNLDYFEETEIWEEVYTRAVKGKK